MSQGKRVIGEDGAEGYSDLFRENAMLQKENGALRLRVKAMQEAIDAINSRVTHLMSQEANLLLAKAGKSGCTQAGWMEHQRAGPSSPHSHPRMLADQASQPGHRSIHSHTFFQLILKQFCTIR